MTRRQIAHHCTRVKRVRSISIASVATNSLLVPCIVISAMPASRFCSATNCSAAPSE